jgi:AcrR family transcriptional regulator
MGKNKQGSDPEKKRADIMQKAIKLFMTKGFDATSTNDICLAAKLTKPSLYHYFESKNHLLFSVHMRAINEILYPYMNEVTAIEEPYERLIAVIRGYSVQICSHPELRFILHGSLSIRDKYFKEIRQEWKKFYLLLRNTISELQSQGRVNKKLKPSWAALHLLGMITWMTYWYDYKSKDQIEAVADATVEMALHGLSPEADPDNPTSSQQK